MRHALRAFALALAAGLAAGCSATGTIDALTPRTTYEFRGAVEYGSHPRQRLDVYRPRTAPAPSGWPVVLFFYGGSWQSGERADYRFVGEALAARGVLAVVADYRLYPEVRYPAFLQDGAAALAQVLARGRDWGGDPGRVFVMGHSAGGYIAAMLALDPRWLGAAARRPSELAGWIGLAGPYDFLPTDNPDVQPVFFHPHYPPEAQPIEFTRTRAPRSFLGAAPRDQVVSTDRSTRQLAERLRAGGTEVELHLYGRANHVTLIGAFAWPLRWVGPVLDDVVAFVKSERPVAGE